MSKQKPNVQASDTESQGSAGDQLLAETLRAMRPLVDLLVAEGVGYPSVSRALRTVFVEAAQAQLLAEGATQTDAAVSLRSGVHRKEVKAIASAQASGPESADEAPRSLSVAEQVFTRWTTDATYRDNASRPAILPLSGPAPSFESLVSDVTRDFSRRTILDELVRIGLVSEQENMVKPLVDAMVPPSAWTELTRYLGNHVHDHIAAGAANLKAARQDESAPFLEHSMYANGLSDQSIEQLSNLAHDVWMPAFNQMVGAAQQRYDLDRDDQRTGRLRFGVYVYSEPDETESAQPATRSTTRKRTRKSSQLGGKKGKPKKPSAKRRKK